MVVEVVRAYLEAASGLTELTRKHAVAVAKILIRESEERPGAPTRSSELPKNESEGGEAALLSARVGPSIQALATELHSADSWRLRSRESWTASTLCRERTMSG